MEKLEIALVDGITSEKLQEIFADGAEVAIDSLLSDGLLKDIPIVGSIYKGTKVAFGIKEALFTKKIFRFLVQLKEVPVEERKKFIVDIESNEEFAGKVGEKLLMILDRLDDLDKPTLIGKLLRLTIEGKYSFIDFLRISSVISQAFLPDLLLLKKHAFVEHYGPFVTAHLITLGLIRMNVTLDTKSAHIESMARLGGAKADPKPKLNYELNPLGGQVQQFLLNCA